MQKPTILKDTEINLEELKKTCQNYIDFIDDDAQYTEDNDFSDYIFENAMEALFGSDVWDFINNRQE